ncbi:MAG: DUF4012 domain-containing protein [Candidatus Dormibacteria bacterium]
MADTPLRGLAPMIAPVTSGSASDAPFVVRVRRRRPRRPNRWRWWLLGGGIALLVVVGIEGVRYASAALALRDGRDQVEAARQVMATDLTHLSADRLSAAEQHLQQAQQDFTSRSELLQRGWLAQLATHLPWISDQVTGTDALRGAGAAGTRVALDIVRMAQQVVAGGGDASASPLQRVVTLSVRNRTQIQSAQADLATLQHALGAVPHATLVGPLESARQTLLKDGNELTNGAGPALTILGALPAAIGPGSHRYLILLENPGEERPSGGYIGAVGVVEFADGRLTHIAFQDSATYQAPVPPLPIPDALDRYLFHGAPFSLEDANWSPDFPSAMADVEKFYTADTGQTVDGDISVDPIAIQYLLQLLGPVSVPPYPQLITSTNALTELNYISNRARPGDPGKAFLAPFGQLVTQDMLQAPVAQLPGLAGALQRAAQEKHVVAYFHQAGLEQLLTGAGLSGAVRPVTSDSVMVDDANLSGTKGDLFVKRQYALDVRVDADGSATDTLTLTYTNPKVTDPADQALLPGSGGQYRDYLRVLLPETVALQNVTASANGGAPAAVAPDSVAYQFEQQMIGLWFAVPVGASEQITLTYRGPLADVSVNPQRYQLSWVKQVNALNWPVAIRVRMPSGKTERWSTPLTTDRSWSVSN